MKDYEYLYATQLHQKLKERIIGHIYTKVTPDDVLHVDISAVGNIKFSTTFPEFSQMILNGYSTEQCCGDVHRRYREHIFKTFFKD